jgi:uncharacterized protein DUF6056
MVGGYSPKSSFGKKLFAVCLFLSLTPYLLLTVFTHPAYDDYTWAVLFQMRGFLRTQAHLYVTYIGRYFSTALVTLSPVSFGSMGAYKAVTFAIVLLTGVSIFTFVNSALKQSVSQLDKLMVSAFLWALFSNQTPDITEAYFWVTSDLVYQVGGILTLFFFALILKTESGSRRSAAVGTFAGGFLIAAIIGCNEVSMLVIDLLIFVIAATAWIKKSNRRWQWTAFIVVATICSLVVILAPGNAVRSSFYPNHGRFFFSIGMSVLQEARFLSTWLTNGAFMLATILFIPAASVLTKRVEILQRIRIHPFLATAVLLLMVFLGFFPAYWGMGMMGQHRTVNTVFFLFISGWFICLASWIDYLRSSYGWVLPPLPRFSYFIGLPLIFLSLCATNNTKEAIGDLISLRAYRYEQKATSRDEWLRTCANKADQVCSKPPISDLPSSITSPYFEDIGPAELRYWQLQAARAPTP